MCDPQSWLEQLTIRSHDLQPHLEQVDLMLSVGGLLADWWLMGTLLTEQEKLVGGLRFWPSRGPRLSVTRVMLRHCVAH